MDLKLLHKLWETQKIYLIHCGGQIISVLHILGMKTYYINGSLKFRDFSRSHGLSLAVSWVFIQEGV